MINTQTKKAYSQMVDNAKRGELKAAVRTAVDADMNMFTLLELNQVTEMEDGENIPLKELAIIGMYIEVEKNKRRLISMGYHPTSYKQLTAQAVGQLSCDGLCSSWFIKIIIVYVCPYYIPFENDLDIVP